LVIHFFVHKALAGVETNILLSQGIDGSAATRAEPAFWLGIATPLLAPLSYVLLYLSTRDEFSSRRQRLARAAFAAVFLAFAGMFLWNYLVALPKASPFLVAQAPQ